MEFKDIIQSVGKQIEKKVYYYDYLNNRVDINEDNIEEIKVAFNCSIVGTLMKSATITLKEIINTTNAIYVDITAKYDEYEETKTYGPYYLYNIEYNADDKTYVHECYDYMLKTMVEYKPINITYPTTVQNFYNTLVNELDLTSNANLVNGRNILEYDIYNGTGYTYRSVLEDIAQANGILLYIEDNELKEGTLSSDNEVTIDDDILKNSNIDFGKTFGPINLVTLSRAGDSDNIYYPSIIPEDLHEFKIADNVMLSENNRDSFIVGIYNKLQGLSYDVFDTELVGYGGFEPLQKINFVTGNNTYTSYVFNNEITYTASYNEVIYTDEPKESETNYSVADTTDNRINQAYIIVNKQNQTITSVVSQVDGQNEKISQLTQTVDELKSEIGGAADITTSVEGTGTIELKNILASETIYLQIKPTLVDINYKITNQTIVGTNTLLTTPTIYYEHINNSGEIDETYSYLLPKPLYYLNGAIYDEYIIDYENNRRYIIHRVGINTDGSKYALDNSYEEDLEYESYMFKKDGDYNIYFKGFPYAYIKVRAMVSNIYTSQYATRVELNSSITQTADKINLKVDAQIDGITSNIEDISGELELKVDKGDNGQIISMINASADQINLTAKNGGLSIKGNKFELDSTNFKVSKNGTIEATNGKFSGTLTSSNATITGGSITVDDTGSDSGNSKININGPSGMKTRIYSDGMFVDSPFGNGEYTSGLMVVKNAENYEVVAGSGLSVFRGNTKIFQADIDEVFARNFRQTSLENEKKNFEYFENGLDIIKNIDIYKYHLKEQKDNEKKHLGFVIGNNYKYSQEITNNENNGVDLYSFISLCCQAIKEQQKQIEILEKRIEALENEK